MRRLRIIYDGACPFCSRYVRLVRLRENFQVDLVDARADPALAQEYTAKGLDLNTGMVAEMDGKTWHGADAIWLLSGLSTRSGVWNRLFARIFASRLRAKLLYPVMRLGRRATLYSLGKKPLP